MGKIYKAGVWPNSDLNNITTTLRVGEDNRTELEQDIQKYEIIRALEQLHGGTSAGTTDIPPELLKHLGGRAITALHQNRCSRKRVPPRKREITVVKQKLCGINRHV